MSSLLKNTLNKDCRFSVTESIFILISAFFVFIFLLTYKINSNALMRWDESLNAQAAYEIAYHGKHLAEWELHGFKWEPNYNTKPELVHWIQAFWMKILGYDSLLAIRLHSVIASVLLFFLLFYISLNEFKSITLGAFSVLILITLKGFLYHHVGRSGDMDSFLLLFGTVQVYAFFKYIENFENTRIRNIYLWIIAIAVLAAIMTKTLAGLFFMPAFLLYSIYRRKLLQILSQPMTYVAMAVVILTVAIYYITRELQYPGHFKKFVTIDIARFNSDIHWAGHPFSFYFSYLFTNEDHRPWILFLPLSLLTIGFMEAKSKRFLAYIGFCVVLFLLIISSSHSKITWYISQIYGWLSIFLALGLSVIIDQFLLQVNGKQNSLMKIGILASIVIGIFTIPAYNRYTELRDYNKRNQEYSGETYDIYNEAFKKIVNSTSALKNEKIKVYHEVRDSTLSFNPQLIYYQKMYNEVFGSNISIAYQPTELLNGDLVLTEKRNTLLFEKRYSLDTIHEFTYTGLYKLHDKMQKASDELVRTN